MTDICKLPDKWLKKAYDTPEITKPVVWIEDMAFELEAALPVWTKHDKDDKSTWPKHEQIIVYCWPEDNVPDHLLTPGIKEFWEPTQAYFHGMLWRPLCNLDRPQEKS